jgi:NAD(P)-dependent dehydrogenase (short-subunit alcohol dehydrogenase family)
MQIQSKTVLITGAGKRIGRQVALELAANGWSIAIHCRSSLDKAHQTQADCMAFGVKAAVFQADLSNEAQVKSLVPNVTEVFPDLIALVNCASTFELDIDAQLSFKTFNQHLHANLAAPIMLSQQLYKHIKAAKAADTRGCVVNFLDQKLWNINPDFLSYSMSKAGLHMATAMLAQSFAPHVRVCGVAPGLTYPSFLQTEREFGEAAKYSLLGTITNPDDLAKTVRFLLETPSITGSSIIVDAGQHLTPMGRDVSFMGKQS